MLAKARSHDMHNNKPANIFRLWTVERSTAGYVNIHSTTARCLLTAWNLRCNNNSTYCKRMTGFQVNPGKVVPHWFSFSRCSNTEPQGQMAQAFLWTRLPCCKSTQKCWSIEENSKYWPKHGKIMNSSQAFFIYHWVPERRGTAVFMPAHWCHYQHDPN